MIGPGVLLSLLLVLVGGLSFRFGLLHSGLGFSIFAFGLVGCGIAALTVTACIFRYLARKQRLARLPLWLILSLFPVVVVIQQVGLAGFQAPPIHDISTDLVHPPVFVFAQAERGPGDNTLVHAGETVAVQQRSGYPQLAPLHLRVSKAEAWAEVMTVIASKGWRLLGSDKSRGHIEAVSTTPLMAFADDLVIRIKTEIVAASYAESEQKATTNNVVVDVRSVSRVGVSDLGANAARIEDFLSELQNRLSEKYKTRGSRVNRIY